MFLSHIFTVSALNMFQIHESPEGPNSPDFRFPGACGENGYPLEDGIRGDERESRLRPQADTQDDYSSYSPPLWKTSPSKADVRPLLPLGHPCSHLSPRSMTQSIANSREEMMKMIRDLPESSYELSLKDIVDLRISQETKTEPPIDEEPGFAINPQPQQRIPKKKISKITRSDSTDNRAFLIKSFFPSLSMSKRKLPPWNMSQIIPRSSSIIGRMRSDNKKHWIGKPANETAGLPNESVNKFRHDDEKHETTGCWPSLSGRKNRTRRKNGCVF